MKEPLRRYEINHPSRCVLDKDSSLKELPGTAETPTLQPACDAWGGMHWQKLSDLGVLIWNVQVSTCLGTLIAKLGCEEPLWDFPMVFPGLSFIMSRQMLCVWFMMILYWSTMDPLIQYGSTIDPLRIHCSFWEATIDPIILRFQALRFQHTSFRNLWMAASWGRDVRHQHHLRLRWFDGLQMTTCFLKLLKFHVILCCVRRINFNKGTTRRICTGASLEACDDLRFLDPNHLSSYADIWRTSGPQRNQDFFWNKGVAALDETVYYMSNKFKRSL